MQVNFDTPGAGPSTVIPAAASSASASTTFVNLEPLTPSAPSHALPSTHFYSIEYPGFVKPESVPLAIKHLGGQSKLDQAFKRTSNKSNTALELNFRPENSFSHPVHGEVVSTHNLLLKVVKRRRKRREGEDEDASTPVGEYTAEVIGVTSKTGRFRSMSDFQFEADMNDPVSKLRSAMDTMDVDGILKYNIPEEHEDYVVPVNAEAMDIDPQLLAEGEQAPTMSSNKVKSNLRIPPPPLFSRQYLPLNYNYKANTASIVTTVVDEETGEEKKRMINRMRWKGFGPIAINFSDKEVPDKPSPAVAEQRNQADQKLLKRLEELFEERPIWTRAAIFNQFEPLEVREIINSKFLLPLVSYVFADGPWRDTQVRHGYDPRTDPSARFYQRLYFRNINHPIVRPSVVGRRQDGRSETTSARPSEPSRKEDRRTHIFDGETVTKETAAFQLCDIHDEMLKEMIEDEEDLRETCNERDGWYSTHAFERIKTVLRHKFFSLLAGHIATREECEALLVPQEGYEKPTRSIHRVRPGKHNMAKGALRPEDAAAQRLMATLDERVKNFSSQQR
ncbi:RNA polymerase III transcription factor IIIC subunit-domain-containing protein [Abortiporus biennis]|nr:RNA polymerase III transcription factor IIIC subunit-domain-containing protein [Abortiporus biennis]